MGVAFNAVRASVLHQSMLQEFQKQEWRNAIARAKARWQAEGGKVQKVRAVGTLRRRGYYID